MRYLIPILTIAALQAQPQFEVAAIKPATPPYSHMGWDGGPGSKSPTRVGCQNCSPAMIIYRAYGIEPYQYSGPDWTGSSLRFEITATMPPDATEGEIRQMLQHLLGERFHLTFHREMRLLPGFELVVGRSASKLKPSPASAVSGSEMQEKPFTIGTESDGLPALPPGRYPFHIVMGEGQSAMRCADETMAAFAARLAVETVKPVVDATGLTAKYDFTLKWIQDQAALPADHAVPGPSLFTALQEQLGLKLQPKRVRTEMFVVDHIDRTPSEN